MRTSHLILAAVLLTGTAAKADTFSITYGAPTVQFPSSTIVSGATVLGTETFDTIPTGSSGFTTDYGTSGAITGTYSVGADIVPADTFGGANGTGHYVRFYRWLTGLYTDIGDEQWYTRGELLRFLAFGARCWQSACVFKWGGSSWHVHTGGSRRRPWGMHRKQSVLRQPDPAVLG